MCDRVDMTCRTTHTFIGNALSDATVYKSAMLCDVADLLYPLGCVCDQKCPEYKVTQASRQKPPTWPEPAE